MKKLFLFGCIPTRLLLAYLVFLSSKENKYKGLLSLLLFLIGLSMLVIHVFGLRDTGLEAGGKIWWDNLRPVHSFLYILASLLLFSQNYHKYASPVVILDTFLGLLFALNHYGYLNTKQ